MVLLSFSYPDTVVNISLIPLRVQLSHYNKPTILKRNLKENSVFLNLDLISGMKYVHLLTENSLVKVGVL